MSYTTTLPLTLAWLVLANNPTLTPIQCGTTRTTNQTDTIDGEFRVYGGGRIQVITRPTDITVVPINFKNLTAAQFAQIKSWRGQLLLYRSIDGDRFFGSYLAVSKTRYLYTSVGPSYDAAVSFEQTTYNEAV